MENLKFEVGEYYRTKDGTKAICLTTTLEKGYLGFEVNGGIVIYSSDGVCMSNPDLSIESEWVDKPIVDWNKMPIWAKFVAMDRCGWWYWYTHRPSKEDTWCVVDGARGCIPSEHAPQFNGDWKKSLIERPTQ